MRVFFVTWELLREISAVQFLSPSGTKISPFTATPAGQSNIKRQTTQASNTSKSGFGYQELLWLHGNVS
eukprot:scaffold23351_cov117-Skeletonema_marinoi.AAC.3